MNKTYNRIIEEEIDRCVKTLNLSSKKDVKKVLNELFTLSTNKLMDNIGSVEANEKNQIAQENWDQFIQNLTNSIQEENDLWLHSIKEIKLKIITYKYFTRNDLQNVDTLEGFLRMEIKPFFTALQNFIDFTDFRHKVLTLPTNILYNLVRYIFNISPELNDVIIIKNSDLKENITRLIDLRMNILNHINEISKGYKNLLNFKELKELYDCGVMFEDNFLNRACSEFVIKMTNHNGAATKLMDQFPGAVLKDLKHIAENTSACISHISSVKMEETTEFFTANGEQIGNRMENEIELVKSNNYDGYVVSKGSRLKEPNEKVKAVSIDSIPSSGGGLDGEGNLSSGGAGGGDGTTDSALDLGLGNADFGGDFAAPGEEGEVPGAEDTGEIGVEEDGTPMPDGEDGTPIDFGTEEDNSPTPEENTSEKPDDTK